MKYRLKQDRNVVAICNEDFAEIGAEIVKDVKKMSFYRSHKEPVLALGEWPGIALWKIKVMFTTDVEKDISYKTEKV
ncbi:MAG TPA: hypothetical protein VK508_18195 [Cyclobacteriaceae bacterium]|nr:hypothetical protein [Cyclobacteriaceae bacterium]